MSTCSKIGIIRNDGTSTNIYCHFDGYLSDNGKTLQKYYNTLDKVEALIALGNISSLGNTPEDCSAYHRDGGEELKFWEYPEEYNYSYIEKDNKWIVEKRDIADKSKIEYVKDLKDALLDEYLESE